jgi:hypothetical protein
MQGEITISTTTRRHLSQLSLEPIQAAIAQTPEIDAVVPCVVGHPHGSVAFDSVSQISKELVIGSVLVCFDGGRGELCPQDIVPERRLGSDHEAEAGVEGVADSRTGSFYFGQEGEGGCWLRRG